MTNRRQDGAAVDEKDAGQLPPVSPLPTRAASERRLEPAAPDARMCQLEERSLLQAKGPIQAVIRIAEPRDVGEAISSEPLVGFLRRLHMHERHLRSRRGEGRANARHVLNRLATERSAEVSEKDQQQRRAIGELANLRWNHYRYSQNTKSGTKPRKRRNHEINLFDYGPSARPGHVWVFSRFLISFSCFRGLSCFRACSFRAYAAVTAVCAHCSSFLASS